MAAEFFAPEEWHMYQMNPAPEKRDLQEYISSYCRLHDDNFLAAFLHRYEDTLNQNVLSYMRLLRGNTQSERAELYAPILHDGAFRGYEAGVCDRFA